MTGASREPEAPPYHLNESAQANSPERDGRLFTLPPRSNVSDGRPGVVEAGGGPAYTRPMRTFIFARGFHRQPTRRQWLVAFALRWLITAAAVWVAAQLIDGIRLEGWGSTLAVALILGLLNAFLKPLLFWGSILLSILTFGIFAILINTALLALTAWIAGKFDDVHFAIDGFGDAFWGAVIISLVSFVLSRFVDVDRLARRVS